MSRTMYVATSYIGVGSIIQRHTRLSSLTHNQIHDDVIMYITSVKKVAITCYVHCMHAFTGMYLMTNFLLATCGTSFFP